MSAGTTFSQHNNALPSTPLVHQNTLSNRLPDCSVIVGPETLCTLLADAEKWNDKSILLEGVKPARIKRKYRQRTPDEQLTISDEEKVREKERRIRRKTEEAVKA